MFEQWQLKDFDAGGGLAAGVPQGKDANGWIAATVPGDTYLALVAAQRIKHPFLGRHEKDAAWVGEREWWWRTTFKAARAKAGERVELVLEGLDTFASIYLNGKLLAKTDNMFRAWRYDVGPLLRADGRNQLAIAFAPATASVAGREMPLWSVASERIAKTRRNFMRKAQFGWGWDWGPYLPTVGVWQPVRLERRKAARLSDVRFTTLATSEGEAKLRIDIGAQHLGGKRRLRADVSLLDPAGKIVANKIVDLVARASLRLKIADPQLWWTADLGAQPLYTLAVRLLEGKREIDVSSRKVGIRTIALDTSADKEERGTNFFRFVLNGVAIFARGANWIPASSFVGAIEPERYRDQLEQAVIANMNMMRVWGGGIYEHDIFYELCDQFGLLVWQDFMFACSPYPEDDPAFVKNVREEVRQQVRRLRHHACLALWCGNNECQVIHDLDGQLTGKKTPLQGALYYDDVIPGVLAKLDPATPYWPGSPTGGPSPNSMRAGDVHNWTVWHGIPPVPDDKLVGGLDRSPAGVAYQRYAEDTGRFISEFGIQASPALSTLRRWMDAGDVKFGSEGMLERIKDEPKDKVNGMLIPVTGLPESLSDYVAWTMFTQAEGLKFGIEHFRRRKPHCAGTLVWQYNDCWPCVSWSLLDYDGVGKAALYTTTRAYAPVLASFKPLPNGVVELWITNDTLQPVSGEAIVELINLAGGIDSSSNIFFDVPANASVSVWRACAPASSREQLLCVRSVDHRFPPNRHLLAPVKDLALRAGARAQVTITQQVECEVEVHLEADAYLLFVQLTSEQLGVRFSDNYFDLRAGESRTVIVRSATALSPGSVAVRCWNQRLK